MVAEHAGDSLQGLELGAQGAGAPPVEELPGPSRSDIVPEQLEVLLEEVGTHGSELVAQQLGELAFLVVGEVLGPLEQTEAHPLEHGLVAGGLEALGFLGAHLVDGLAEVGHEVEAVEDLEGAGRFAGDHLQRRVPRARAAVAETGAALGAEPAEEAEQRLRLASLPAPEQPAPGGAGPVE